MSLDIWLTMNLDTGGSEPYEVSLYDANYTSNVTPMWIKAGVYDALYDSAGKLAREIVPALESGVTAMGNNPDDYKALNPENGWGDYEGALKFLRDFLDACRRFPKATIGAWK